MSNYKINIVYIPDSTNAVADALSRVCFCDSPKRTNSEPVIEVDTLTQHIPATSTKLQDIRNATNKDVTLSHLKGVIYHEWPEHMKDCTHDLKEFWNYREDLNVESGLLLKGHRLIIPFQMRPQMLMLIHQDNFGMEKFTLKARECLFWPGITKYIKEIVSNCTKCLQFAKQQQKETFQQHSLPSYPWQKLASDLFDFKGAHYLIVADYYSKFPVVRKLNSTTSSVIINHLKSIFAEYGIPHTIITDNGPQYSSKEFQRFCDTWGIEHTTSLPVYPQSNWFSERMVQTVKDILKKSGASN